MRSRILTLFLGLALSSVQAFSQIIACQVVQGNWTDNGSGQEFSLSQDSKGNVTGSMTWPICTGNPVWPITGTAGSGTFSFVATNQGCTNFSGGATATFSGTIGQPGCNFLYGTQTNANGSWYYFGVSNPYPTTQNPTSPNWVAKAVDVPTSETSAIPPPASWNTTKGAPWNQTLAPNSPPGEFEGRGVYEYGAGLGTDTCWFAASKFAVFNTITTPGFGWTVTSKNGWGADFIGWTLAAVKYYRAQKKVPCGTSFPQQTVVDAAYSPDNTPLYASYLTQGGDVFYAVPYETNNLGGNITATSVTSVRNSQTSTNTTWK